MILFCHTILDKKLFQIHRSKVVRFLFKALMMAFKILAFFENDLLIKTRKI